MNAAEGSYAIGRCGPWADAQAGRMMFDGTGPAIQRKRRTSASAVAGFVFALLGPLAPLGLGFSIIGLFQTRGEEQGGRAFAVAGTVLGALFTVPLVVWFFFLRG